MHDPVRYAAQQESIETLPPMGADHDEVVAMSRFAHNSHGISRTNHGRHCEVRAGQRLGRVVHDLFSMPSTFLGPAFESLHQTLIDHLERGNNRENGDRDGVLEGVRCQPSMQMDRVLSAFHRHEDARDGPSFSFHDQGRHRRMEQDAVRNAAGKHF